MNVLFPTVLAVDDTKIPIARGPNVQIESVGKLISGLINALLVIAALLAFIYLVLGGLQWITSGGDKAGMEGARNKITHAIVGLIVVAAAYAIMVLVGNFLGISITDLNLGTVTGK
jgi:hypothetical protein